MIYIPNDWIVNINNISSIQEIFNKYYYTDLVKDGFNRDDIVLNELNKLGESILVDKFKNGDINLGLA